MSNDNETNENEHLASRGLEQDNKGRFAKKGRPSWRPADMLTIHNMDDNYRYRWERNDPAQIQKALAEGWEVVSLSADKSRRSGNATVEDGAKLTSLDEYRELIKLRMPKELAEERNRYFQSRSEQMIRATKQNLERDVRALGPKAPGVRGKVVIE